VLAPLPYVAVFKFGRRRRRVEFNARGDANALRYASGLLRSKIGGQCVSVRRSSSKPRSGRNPAPARAGEAAQAARALEEFTGHPAKLSRTKAPKVGRAGWVLGKLVEVSYIATRDGETVEYVHRFKRRSRPQLVSSADGSQLYLLGGAYSVTDRGIEDA